MTDQGQESPSTTASTNGEKVIGSGRMGVCVRSSLDSCRHLGRSRTGIWCQKRSFAIGTANGNLEPKAEVKWAEG